MSSYKDIRRHPISAERDLEAAAVPGDGTVETPDGKVTGKDGKKHAASKGPAVICRHCEHRKNMGRPLIENCPDCADLRKVIKPKKAKKEPLPEPTTTEEAIKDDAGTVVPARLVPMFKTIADFADAERLLNATSKAFQKIEQGPAKDLKPLDENGHYRKYFATFKSARLRLKAMRPSLVCGKCEGDGCGSCQDGVVTKERVL